MGVTKERAGLVALQKFLLAQLAARLQQRLAKPPLGY